MGLFSSKTLENMLEESEAAAGKFSSPEHVKKLPLDPRSPSDEIARTPILVEQTPSTEKLEDTLDAANSKLLRTPLGIANSRSTKKGSLSQRIFGKFSEQTSVGKEKCDPENYDENDMPVQLLHFELSPGDQSNASDISTSVGKTQRI